MYSNEFQFSLYAASTENTKGLFLKVQMYQVSNYE